MQTFDPAVQNAALDEFSAMIKGWDVSTLRNLRDLAAEGLAEGRPGNYAGILSRLDLALSEALSD